MRGLEIQHTGKDLALTDALREHATEKFEKALSTMEGRGAMSLHLTYETVGHASHGANQKIHAVLFLPRHEPLAVSETCESLYTSIDLAAKELERQVRRYREKMQGKQRAR